MSYVFVSYAIEDIDSAKRICAALKSLAIDYWLDENRIRPGWVWEENTESAIEEAACAIFLVSNTSLSKKGYIQRELELLIFRAKLRSKSDNRPFLFPIKIEAVDVVATPIGDFQFVDLSDLTDLPSGKVVLRLEDILRSFEAQAREDDKGINYTQEFTKTSETAGANAAPPTQKIPYTPNNYPALFNSEELDIYCNKETGEAHIFYGKKISLEIKEARFFNSNQSMVVVYKNGDTFDLGVKIQWLVRPYISRATEISFVRTKNREPVEGEIVPLINMQRPHEHFGSNLAKGRIKNASKYLIKNVFSNFFKK